MAKIAEDIISLPIELTPKMADSKFRLVHIASQRVRELSAGETPLVTSRSIKDTTVALEESLLGAYKITVGEEAKVAKEELRKRKEQEKLEEQLSAKEEEIRKELSAYLTDSASESEEGELGEAEGAEEDAEPAADEESEEAGETEE
ncbi:MAG: DNA-directed RNA polymerase subunit omega [Nitrospirota bacterium]